MKKLLTLIILTVQVGFVFSQERHTVTLTLKYKNNPLCNYNVTIYNGDIPISTSKSNDKGVATFSNASLLSRSINASGVKTANGSEKKWDVKGFITLDDSWSATLNFEQLIQEMGAPESLMAAAWGLTIMDCSGSSSSNNSGTSSQGSGNQNNDGIIKKEESSTPSTTTQNEEPEEQEKSLAENMADMKAQREQQQADRKAMLEQEKAQLTSRVQNLESKILKRKAERDSKENGTKEWSDLAYEVRDLELEKSIVETKLERTTDELAYGNQGLSKAERESYKNRLDKFETEQKETRRKQKDDVIFGQAPASEVKSETKEEKSEVKTEKKKEEKAEEKKEEKKSSDEEEFKVYTSEEIANMSAFNLKKLKLDTNGGISRRNFTLKTKKALLKPEEKTKIEKEILDLENLVKLIEAELIKREGTEEKK
jgi:hypothetical protein